MVSESEAIEASAFKLDLGVPVVDQLHEYFSSLPEPDLSKATQSVQAQFFHSLKKLCEAYVANPTSEILARILILPKLDLSSKLGAKSAPMAITLMHALQDLTVLSLSASYCLARAPPLPREELAAKLIAKGNLGKAFRRLSTNDSVPVVTPDVIVELERLQCPHVAPYKTGLGPPPSASHRTCSRKPSLQ